MSACIPGARTSWTARTTTATNLVGGWSLVIRRQAGLRPACLVLLFCVAATIAAAQNPRSHTRLDPRGTRVTQSQAETVTLTLGTAEVRLLQTWVRTAGTIDKTGKILRAKVSGSDEPLVKDGQELRTFPTR